MPMSSITVPTRRPIHEIQIFVMNYFRTRKLSKVTEPTPDPYPQHQIPRTELRPSDKDGDKCFVNTLSVSVPLQFDKGGN